MAEEEKLKIPDIKMQELLRVVERIATDWEKAKTEKRLPQFGGTEYSYNNSNFMIWDQEPETADPKLGGASFEAWDKSLPELADGGWSIDLLSTLSGVALRRRIFHEILEANLKEQGFGNAHEITVDEEEKQYGKLEDRAKIE